jgi:VanZ family protein
MIPMSPKMKAIVRYWLPPVIWGALIFSGSSVSTPSVSPVYWQNFVAHKIVHIIEYSILATLVYRGFINSGVSKKQAFIYAVIIAFIYGLSDEFHQSFTPHRDSRFRDVIIDTIGGSIGVYFVWKWLPKMRGKLLSWAKKLDLV